MKYALVFHTTHQTMLAEEVLSLNRYHFDTLPLPRDIKAGCTLALSVKETDVPAIIGTFKNENIVIEGLYAITGHGWKRLTLKEDLKKQLYLDCNATTPTAPEVFNAMLPFLEEHFGNPSSIHSFGRETRWAIDEARERVAGCIGADPSEIIFTGGGSESNNLAIKGAAFARAGMKGHIITSAIEHSSVLCVCKYLEKIGCDVTYLPVDHDGMIDASDVEKAVREDTFLITVQWANNEVGTIEPVARIGAAARERSILFHTDAVQAVGKIPVDVGAVPVDLLTFSAHKFYGPKGVGGLYAKHPQKLIPLIHGGRQERGMRSGTENVAGIVGMGAAAVLAAERSSGERERLSGIRDLLCAEIQQAIPGVQLNGHRTERLPNTANLSFPGIDGESLLINLDLEGIKVSTGAACASGSIEPSHVLAAMGVAEEYIQGSLRFSLGAETTAEDVTAAARAVAAVVKRLSK
jgi:cysteine desulfurase